MTTALKQGNGNAVVQFAAMLVLAASVATQAHAATMVAEHSFVVRTDLGELVAQEFATLSEPDTLFSTGYQLAPFDPDYVTSSGLAGDRYGRALTAAGIGTASGYGGLQLGGTGRGTWSDVGTASGTGTANVTALFRGAVGFDDPHTLAARNNFVCGAIPSCENILEQQFAFNLSSDAGLRLLVEDTGSGDTWSLFANFQIGREIVLIDMGGGVFQFFGQDNASASWTSHFFPSGGGAQLIGSWFGNRSFDPETGGLRSFWEEMNLALPVPFVAGRNYRMSLEISCVSEASGITNFLFDRGPASTFCQLDQSGYLTGFTDFRDAFGNPIAPFGLFARDGTNLALPSPFAPGGPGGPIPEPATWALLIAGFGLVGGTLRRRRAEGAAA